MIFIKSFKANIIKTGFKYTYLEVKGSNIMRNDRRWPNERILPLLNHSILYTVVRFVIIEHSMRFKNDIG